MKTSQLACVSAMRVAPPATPVTARQMLPRQAISRKAPGNSGEASSSARPVIEGEGEAQEPGEVCAGRAGQQQEGARQQRGGQLQC